MQTFAQKQNQSQKTASTSLARPDKAIYGPAHREHTPLHLQQTNGNHAMQRMLQTETEQPEAELTEPASPHFGHDFSQFPVHSPAAGMLQAKLAISVPGDSYEQEADRVAEEVMRTPEPQLQRASSSGGGCPKCHSESPGPEKESLRTKRVQASDTGQITAPPIIHEVLRSPGQPLDPATRAFMEPRFGYDFSRVRVHTGQNSAASAKAVGALAYAYGSDIVFGAGQYSPYTCEGRRLLAHELAHVVQQQSIIQQSDALADGNTASEIEAERATAATHQYGIAMIREKQIQLKRGGVAKPTQITLIKHRSQNTARIDDAYVAGSLDKDKWHDLLDSAKQAIARREVDIATSFYLSLYADVAKLAQATLVGGINVVTGHKHNCKDARPGLNFSPRSAAEWGGGTTAAGTTAPVDERGHFGVESHGGPQMLVAIVLNRDAFSHEKEQTLAVLRHEMEHAEHFSVGKVEVSNRAGAAGANNGNNNSELLARVEGFMTMFHLTPPSNLSNPHHPAFIELLGATNTSLYTPWKDAAPLVKSEALGRLQEYYCNALDAPHLEAFDCWVNYQLNIIRNRSIDEFKEWGFFLGLQRIIANKCKGVRPPMKL